MFLFGGTKFDTIDNGLFELNYKTNTWIQYPSDGDVPYPCSTPLMSYHDGVIYLFGGEIPDNSDNVLPSNNLYAYSIEDQFWTIIQTAGTKPLTRYLGRSAVYNDYLYIFYGYNDEYEIDIDDIYRISLKTYIWEYVDIDRISDNYDWYPRDGYGLVLHNEDIYIFGGWTYLGLTNILLRGSLVNYIQDSSIIQFRQKIQNSDMPSPRSHHTMVPVGKKFYIFGGENKGQL